jgi:F0F1-type ATP synthase delta subunit
MSKITTQELAKYVVDQLEAGVDSSALAEQISAYLLEERRTRELPAILRAVDLELSRRGNDQVVITAAHVTSSDVKKQISDLLGVKNPTFTEIIDQNVIGGVKARSGETEIDLTVRGRLNRFKNNIVNQEN